RGRRGAAPARRPRSEPARRPRRRDRRARTRRAPGSGGLALAAVLGVDAEAAERAADLEHEELAVVGSTEPGRPAALRRGVGERDEEGGAGRVEERDLAHVDDEQLTAQAAHPGGDL